MRALGLDIGHRRVGLALSDPLGLFAQAYDTLPRGHNDQKLAKEIALIVKKEDIEQLVVGLPLNLDGSVGIQAKRIERVIEIIQKEISLPIDRVDERLTTIAAERILIEGQVRRNSRKKVVDQIAAAMILQAWLDKRQHSKNSHSS